MSPRRSLVIAAALALAAGAAAAHGPTRQKVTETIAIDAPPQAVWARIRDFSALKDWHPAVADSPASQGNEIGSVREIVLRDGGRISERLERWDDAAMSYGYRANPGGALPVTNYVSTIAVRPDAGGSRVEWRGAFYRGWPNNDPPPEQNDEAAVRAVTGVYQSGLANLKRLVEGR